MKKRLSLLGILSLFFLSLAPRLAFASESSAGGSYHAAGSIAIKGQGGWDALSIDPESHRLFVSHADRVVVINTLKNEVIKEIQGTPGVHCIALAPDLKKAFATNGKEGKVSVINLETLEIKSKVKVGEKPDAVVYDSISHEVYVFNADSSSLTIIDGRTENVVATVALPGQPEFAVADSANHRVYVNLENKNAIAVIDTSTHKVVNTWTLEACEGPTGIALDVKNQRLFSACANQKMAMVDARTGKTLATIQTGEGTDGADFDPETGFAFSSNGKSGTVTIVKAETPSHLALVQTLKTQIGARTLVLNPKDHRLYLPTADFEPAKSGGRPKPIDGTQRVLVFEQ